MGLMDRYNKGGVRFDIDINGFTFMDLESLFKKFGKDTVYRVDGIYINKKSSFGDHPVAILGKEEILADLPGHVTEDVKGILQDEEVIAAIKAGKVGFSIQEYEQKKFKKTCYGIHWEDIE